MSSIDTCIDAELHLLDKYAVCSSQAVVYRDHDNLVDILDALIYSLQNKREIIQGCLSL